MNKFIIEKAIIEKTDKDINICDNYKFTSGLNLICGANEVGKSSLMKFLRTSLLFKSNNDVGKVFISTHENHYLIQAKQKPKDRTAYSLSDDKKIDINFLKEHIHSKAFEYVFSMNLDDLMAIKDTSAPKLIELMKDSSCEYLNEYLSTTKTELDKKIGTKGVKDKISKIRDSIILLDKKIKEYSNNEKDYINIVNALNNINEELRSLSKKEDLLKINNQISKLDEKIKEIENDYNSSLVNFNSNLAQNSSEYLKLNEKALNYTNNLEKITENEAKIDSLNAKIMFAINKLKKEFFVNFSFEELKNFKIDYTKKKLITESLEKLETINTDLTICLNDKKNIEEQLSSINKKIEILNLKYKFSDSIEELEELHKYIDSGLKYYNHLQNEISEAENNTVVNYKGLISNKNLLAIFCLISILSISFTCIGFYHKMYLLSSFALTVLILSVIVIYSLKIAIDKSKGLSELENKKIAKEKIAQNLIDKIKDIYPEVINSNPSLMILKINDLKQEIHAKKEQLEEKLQDQSEKNQKLDKVEIDIDELEKIKDEINAKNKEAIEIDFKNIDLSANEYLQMIDLIENVKDIILEKSKLEKINIELKVLNDEIETEFKNFVIKNKINIPFENEFSKKIEQLQAYYLVNSKLNGDIDALKIKLDGYIEQKNELKNKKEKNPYCNEQIFSSELELEINNKNKQREELLGQKNALEHIEGLENLKIKRNIIQAKYTDAIRDLLKDKILIALCEKAKSNFDKKQPNLQKAQEFLSIMTNGKYTKINLDNEIIQNDSGTIIKEWKNLSRGTKELLYFALKLGFASNYSKDKVTLEPNGRLDLPLIIDDALVNFDTERTKNAIKCLKEFSKTNQVLFFTCHSENMKKYFEELCEDFNVVNL